MTETKQQDNWSSKEYQNAASFVPKLAVEIMKWLNPQKDDEILDIGCGGQLPDLPDGVLDIQIAQIVAQGRGRLHGIDSSASMIGTAMEAASDAGLKNCTFEVCDATDLVNKPELQGGTFTKVFSNAAMHWILRPEDKREQFFVGVKNALVPGGTFAFEMGGLGNVSELKAGIFSAVGRRIGLARAVEASPWFFPDEDWMRQMMENTVGGWTIERMERVWRPTTADAGGVDAWIRLMAKQFFDAVQEDQREECIREVVEVLEKVCAKPGGGYMFSYVRLRVLARKL